MALVEAQYENDFSESELLSGQEVSETADFLRSSKPSQEMMESISPFPAMYAGKWTPASKSACYYIARGVDDVFDQDMRKCRRHESLDYNFFGILETEIEQGRSLVAFGDAWMIFGVKTYLKNNGLEDTRLVVHDTQPIMVFAHVNTAIADSILRFLPLDMRLFSFEHTAAQKDMAPGRAYDLAYLFPVETSTIGRYTQVSSTALSQTQVERLVHFNEVVFEMPRLDTNTAIFATWLLSETLFFDHVMSWRDGALVLENVGWIQALAMERQFGLLLNQIRRSSTYFEHVGSYAAAVRSGRKCFQSLGSYVAAIVPGTDTGLIRQEVDPHSFDPVPLRSVDTIGFRQYMRSLGYNTTRNPLSVHIDIPLIPVDGGYTYETSSGVEGFIPESNHSSKQSLQSENVPRDTRELMRAYPGFVPHPSMTHATHSRSSIHVSTQDMQHS